jgi:hypothetical protein
MKEPKRIPLTDSPRCKEPEKIPLKSYPEPIVDDLWDKFETNGGVTIFAKKNNENNTENNP